MELKEDTTDITNATEAKYTVPIAPSTVPFGRVAPDAVDVDPKVVGLIDRRDRLLVRTRVEDAGLHHSPQEAAVGGLRFVKLGRFTFMWTISKEYKPL